MIRLMCKKRCAKKTGLEGQLSIIDALQLEMDDAVELLELGIVEGDEEIAADAEASLFNLVSHCRKTSA